MSSKQRLFSYIGKEKKTIIFFIISLLIFVLAHLAIPYLVGKAIDSVGYLNEENHFVITADTKLIMTFIIIAFSLSIIGLIFDYIFEFNVAKMTQKIVKTLRDDIFKKLNNISIETIHKNDSGNLLQIEIGDVENITNGIHSVFKQLIQGILTILVTIILMFMLNWILALGVVLLSPLSVIFSRFVASFSHKYFKKQAGLVASLNAYSLEGINNLELVQSLNYQEESIFNYQTKDEELRKQGKIAQFSASWTNPTTRLVNNIIYAIIGISGVILIMFTPTYPILMMSIGKLSSFLSYTTGYTKPFNEVSSVLSEFEVASSSFRRVNNFLNLDDDIDEGDKLLNEKIENITFENMSFSYDLDKKLIECFNENIKRGNKVAIVGPTGAGKSTLINLLLRFYDPNEGKININGISSKEYKKSELRKHFGLVLQESWIFKGTIMENVRYAKLDATDQEVIDACKRARADSFINTLPKGYDTVVSNKHGLSDGERQMLCIAKVMLLNPDIVILDEATSNVDTRTEKLITEAFDALLENKTSIVIAHRLSTIKKADLILVLKDGAIIEQGNHKELLEKKGFYSSMYLSQFK